MQLCSRQTHCQVPCGQQATASCSLHLQLCLGSRPRIACSPVPAWGRGASQAEPQLSVGVSDPLHPISGVALQPRQCMMPTLASFGAAILLVVLLLQKRERKAAVKEEPDVDLVVSNSPSSADPLHHQRVIAKTRQAAHISSAVAYNRAGEITKAVLELNKALANNSICRSPATVTHTKDELAGLYRLHMMHTEQPPNFAVLLQLQEMLGISQEEAERIEVAVLRSPGAFAI